MRFARTGVATGERTAHPGFFDGKIYWKHQNVNINVLKCKVYFVTIEGNYPVKVYPLPLTLRILCINLGLKFSIH